MFVCLRTRCVLVYRMVSFFFHFIHLFIFQPRKLYRPNTNQKAAAKLCVSNNRTIFPLYYFHNKLFIHCRCNRSLSSDHTGLILTARLTVSPMAPGPSASSVLSAQFTCAPRISWPSVTSTER